MIKEEMSLYFSLFSEIIQGRLNVTFALNNLCIAQSCCIYLSNGDRQEVVSE